MAVIILMYWLCKIMYKGDPKIVVGAKGFNRNHLFSLFIFFSIRKTSKIKGK